MIQATIRAVEQGRIVKTGEEFLDVTVDFHEEVEVDGEVQENVLDTRKYGYPLGTSSKEIQKSVKKAVATMTQEREQAEQQKDVDATNKQAKQVAEDLAGLTI